MQNQKKKYTVTYRLQGEVTINLTPLVEFFQFCALLLMAFLNENPNPRKPSATVRTHNEAFSEAVMEDRGGAVSLFSEGENIGYPEPEPEPAYSNAYNFSNGHVETVPQANVKSCANCGQRFTGKRSDAKFCSDSCKNEFNNPKRKG